jgi:hypothetical protein
MDSKIIFDGIINLAFLKDCMGRHVTGLPEQTYEDRLVVIDLEPEANLGHAFLYVICNTNGGAILPTLSELATGARQQPEAYSVWWDMPPNLVSIQHTPHKPIDLIRPPPVEALPSAQEARERSEAVLVHKKADETEKYVPIIHQAIEEAINTGEFYCDIPNTIIALHRLPVHIKEKLERLGYFVGSSAIIATKQDDYGVFIGWSSKQMGTKIP